MATRLKPRQSWTVTHMAILAHAAAGKEVNASTIHNVRAGSSFDRQFECLEELVKKEFLVRGKGGLCSLSTKGEELLGAWRHAVSGFNEVERIFTGVA